jgi:hypothetical protein
MGTKAVSAQADSHRSGLGPSTGKVMWDFWWKKWHRGRLSPSTYVYFVNHYTCCSTSIHHPGLRRTKWTQSHPALRRNLHTRDKKEAKLTP